MYDITKILIEGPEIGAIPPNVQSDFGLNCKLKPVCWKT